MMNLLAETATSATLIPGEWVISLLVALVAAVGGVYLKRAGLAQGRREALQIGPQPFEVAVRENFVTRTECVQCKTDMKGDVREMKALYDKALTLILERDAKTAAQISQLGDRTTQRFQELEAEGAERRRRIHDKLNEHSDLLSRIDARTDVSKSIGRLGSAIVTLAKKEPN